MMLGRISQVDVETNWLPISSASPPLPCRPVSVSRHRISQYLLVVLLFSTAPHRSRIGHPRVLDCCLPSSAGSRG